MTSPICGAGSMRSVNRPATLRAYARAQEFAAATSITSEESRKILFGQTAASVGGKK